MQFIEQLKSTQRTTKSVIPSEHSESRNLRITVAAQQVFSAKILRLRCTSYSFAQDDKLGRLPNKLKFDCRRNDTEPSERVTTSIAPSTHCHRALRGKLKFEQQ